MTSKVLLDIENADLSLCEEEFRKWLLYTSNHIDGIFSIHHQDYFLDPAERFEAYQKDSTPRPTLVSKDDIDRLCSEFETVFEYAKHAEARQSGRLVFLKEIEPITSRFTALGGLSWKRLSPYVDDTLAQTRRPMKWDQGLCALIGKHTEARMALDYGHYISIAEIALLARIDERTVFNATLDKRPESRLTIEEFVFPKHLKYVESKHAEKWLEGRRKFKRTVAADFDADVLLTEEEKLDDDFSSPLFVPVANDGTFFDPRTCKSKGGFSIGEKGSEEKYNDFLEALAGLQQMQTPYWRRPNPNGHFGIVKGVSWKRVTIEELGIEPLGSGAENLASIFEED